MPFFKSKGIGVLFAVYGTLLSRGDRKCLRQTKIWLVTFLFVFLTHPRTKSCRGSCRLTPIGECIDLDWASNLMRITH